jgi:hypothetical protein
MVIVRQICFLGLSLVSWDSNSDARESIECKVPADDRRLQKLGGGAAARRVRKTRREKCEGLPGRESPTALP